MRILFLVILLVFTACQTKPPSTKLSSGVPFHKGVLDQSITLRKEHFDIVYSVAYRNPVKVSYSLKKEKLQKKDAKRKDKFFADPQLIDMSIQPVKPSDYLRSGYDRGHMAASDDFVWSQEANDQTFVMTNMTPQRPSLNRGSWSQLEQQIRRWACGEGELYIEVGPIIEEGLSRLPSGVSIPQRFYKVILDRTPPIKSVGFIYTQEDGGIHYEGRAMAVRDVEKKTGDIFFSKYRDSEATKESFHLKSWAEEDCQPKKGSKMNSKKRKGA